VKPASASNSEPNLGDLSIEQLMNESVILGIPQKKSPQPMLGFMTPAEIDAVLDATDEAISSIATTESASSRATRLIDWRDQSAEVFYRRYQTLFGKSGRVAIEDLHLPSWDGLLRHFRLDVSALPRQLCY
jgi:hypothetical protein